MNPRTRVRRLVLALAAVLCFTAVVLAVPPDEPEPRLQSFPWMSLESWQMRHQRNLDRKAQGPIDLLFLGDSITEGWGGNAVWREHYQPRNAANFGIGGDTTQEVLWRITEGGELEGISPKVTVLLIGTNNLWRDNASPADIARGVKKICSTIREKLPATKLLVMAVFPLNERPDHPARASVAGINTILAALDDGSNVRFLDIGPGLTQSDGVISKEVMPDYLHLSEHGYRIWADQMNPLLLEMMGEGK